MDANVGFFLVGKRENKNGKLIRRGEWKIKSEVPIAIGIREKSDLSF
jgi:hypothetical protein